MADGYVLGLDPGHKKCGLALVAADGRVVERGVIPPDGIPAVLAAWVAKHAVIRVVVGDGTRSGELAAVARAAAGADRVVVRDEVGTTLEARARYCREHPPRGLWRLVPTTLRLPLEPFDDLVAAILADRYWAELAGDLPG